MIKVENGNGAGDRFRGSGTIPSPAFAFANRGKRSVTLDTKQEAGLAALKKLMRDADVFLQNFRPGVAERMGIGYDAAKRLNPAIIYVSISGFGPDGPCKCSLVLPLDLLSTQCPWRAHSYWQWISLARIIGIACI